MIVAGRKPTAAAPPPAEAERWRASILRAVHFADLFDAPLDQDELRRRRGVICGNYLVDKAHLRLPQEGDLYAGHQMLYLRPLTGSSFLPRLFDANPWVHGCDARRRCRPPGGPWSPTECSSSTFPTIACRF